MSAGPSERSKSMGTEDRVARALDAFRVAMRIASDERIWRLHGALEKDKQRIVRGFWGRADGAALSPLFGRAVACPLTTLYVGVPECKGDLARAEELAERDLNREGFSAADFYGPWDAGLISARELLRVVDREASARCAAGPRSRRSG